MSDPCNADPVPKWEQLLEAIVAAERFQGSAALAKEGVYPPQFWFHYAELMDALMAIEPPP